MADNISRLVMQRFKNINTQLNQIHARTIPSFDDVLTEMDFLQHCIQTGQIKFAPRSTNQSNDKENINTANETPVGDVPEDGQPKKKVRGRQRKTRVLHEKRTDSSSTAMSDSPGVASLNDSPASVSSTSSTRSKRAAAQAVGEKMEKVKNLMGNKKLRRPTDFDDFKKPLPADASSPPTKSRKTRSKQSAGSSKDEAEGKGTVSGGESSDSCQVLVKRMSTPEVRKLTNKRGSDDMFENQTPPCDKNEELTNATHVVAKQEPKRKRPKGKKGDVSSSDSEMRNSPQQISPIMNQSVSAALGKAIAHSSPITGNSPGGEFHGFDTEPVVQKPTRSKRGDKGDIVAEKSIHIDQRVTRKTVNNAEAQDVEVVETETNIRSRTRVLKKVNDAVEENHCNQTYTCDIQEEEASAHSRTRVIKKEPVEDGAQSEVPRTRTRALKKSNEKGSAEDDSPVVEIHSRTRVIKKEPVEDGAQSEVPRTRTRALKKSNEKGSAEDDSPVVEIKPLPRTGLSKTSSQSSEDEETKKTKLKRKEEKMTPEIVHPQQKKLVDCQPSRSPATVKGELVRKRVEDFEKIKNTKEQVAEPSTAPRVTRQAAKVKPSTDPKGKTPSSLPRPLPIPNNSAVVLRPAVDGTEERTKEERQIKRQAKEEEVVRKKEKLLKASAEETKRKREEKNQKAAAAREAAEKEKAALAARAEREKEEKLRQLQQEKEKQKKDEILKKKLLLQQKTKEHEERRKQEESARLARLKEQEEEHKRALAMKEREMEQQRQQKAAEQRVAEAEKAKQAAKLGKVAVLNNAKAKAATSTPTPGSKNPESYEITPARDEKTPLQPKTEDDYGIDDANSSDSSEDEDNPRKQIPLWAQAQKRRVVLKMQKFLPESLRDAFFENKARMPDAADIFKGFQVKKRIRTSSACWRTPPLSKK